MEYLFETEHLRIRKFEMDDAGSLYENHLEEEAKKWIPNESYADVEEARGAIKFYVDCVNGRRLPYVLAAELKETGELIGDTGVNEVEGNSNEVEIGYGICKRHSGNGYATELLKAMTQFITETFGINILYGRVMRGNNASVRVLEKNGYTFVREEFGAEDDPYGRGMLIYKKDCSTETGGLMMEKMEKTEKTTEEYEKKLKSYYDEAGRLTQYPSRRPMRILALTKIADQFEPSRKYTEKEVNEIIRANIAFGDIELVRREMFQYRLIDRLRDGSAYWREEK